MDAVLSIYDEKVNPKLSVRRITITANKIVSEDDVPREVETPVQFNLFDDIAAQEQQHKDEEIRKSCKMRCWVSRRSSARTPF